MIAVYPILCLILFMPKTTTHTLKSFSFSYDTVSLTLLNQKKGFSFLYKLFLRTGRLFGGLINDIKRKAPWYLSDYKAHMSL